MIVRQARWRDVAAMVRLAERRRALLAELEPLFWRRAARAAAWTRLHFCLLLLNPRAALFVAEEQGELIGMLTARRVPAPPVYHPGGASLLIDDFWVGAHAHWPTAGAALIEAVIARGRRRGAAQIIVIAAVGDRAASDCLAANGLSPVSSWWVKRL